MRIIRHNTHQYLGKQAAGFKSCTYTPIHSAIAKSCIEAGAFRAHAIIVPLGAKTRTLLTKW